MKDTDTRQQAPLNEAQTLLKSWGVEPTAPADGERGARRGPLFSDYLTLAEMAHELGVSERTLTRWHSLRVGPPRTIIGRKILYHAPAARAWMAAQTEEVPQRGKAA